MPILSNVQNNAERAVLLVHFPNVGHIGFDSFIVDPPVIAEIMNEEVPILGTGSLSKASGPGNEGKYKNPKTVKPAG